MIPRRRVLLVDDSEDAREMYSLVLDAAGFDVAVAADPRQAVELARAGADAVVLDYAMPKMNGADLALRLKQEPATAAAKYVLITGHGPTALQDSARKTNFDAMLRKPLAPDQLARVVRRLLGVA